MLGVLFGMTQSSTFQGGTGKGLQYCRAEECAAAAEPFAAATRTTEGDGMGRWGAMVELVGERGGEGSGGTSLDD